MRQLLVVILCLMFSTQVFAESVEDAESVKKEQKKYGVLVILDSSLGIGTFIKDEYKDNPSFAQSISLRPKYTFYDDMFVQLRWDMAYEYTEIDNETGRRFEPYDPIITISDPMVYTEKNSNLKFAGFFRFTLPVSYVSRFSNRYTTLAGNVSVARDFLADSLSFQYDFRYTKSFNKYTTKTVDNSDSSDYKMIRMRRGAEELSGGISTGSMNESFNFINNLYLGYAINDMFTCSINMMFINRFDYPIDVDDKSVDLAIERGRADQTWGTIALDINIHKNIILGLGVTSLQSAKTADNESFRFPFYDFNTTADNLTSLYFDIIATF